MFGLHHVRLALLVGAAWRLRPAAKAQGAHSLQTSRNCRILPLCVGSIEFLSCHPQWGCKPWVDAVGDGGGGWVERVSWPAHEASGHVTRAAAAPSFYGAPACNVSQGRTSCTAALFNSLLCSFLLHVNCYWHVCPMCSSPKQAQVAGVSMQLCSEPWRPGPVKKCMHAPIGCTPKQVCRSVK